MIVRAAAMAVLFLLTATAVYADGAETVAMMESPAGESIDPRESLILFYSDACPHCHNQMRWMERVGGDFPDVEFHLFEIQVSNNRENQEYFARVMEAYDSNTRGWPRTVIGDRVFIGFDPGTGAEQYVDRFAAWVGFRNQLYQALEAVQAGE